MLFFFSFFFFVNRIIRGPRRRLRDELVKKIGPPAIRGKERGRDPARPLCESHTGVPLYVRPCVPAPLTVCVDMCLYLVEASAAAGIIAGIIK